MRPNFAQHNISKYISNMTKQKDTSYTLNRKKELVEKLKQEQKSKQTTLFSFAVKDTTRFTNAFYQFCDPAEITVAPSNSVPQSPVKKPKRAWKQEEVQTQIDKANEELEQLKSELSPFKLVRNPSETITSTINGYESNIACKMKKIKRLNKKLQSLQKGAVRSKKSYLKKKKEEEESGEHVMQSSSP